MINNRSQQLIPEWHLEAICQCGTTKHSLIWHSGLSCRPLINRKPFTPIKLQGKTQKNLPSHLAYCTTLHPAYDEIFGTFYTLVIYINNDLKNDYLSHASSTMPLSGVVKRIFAALKAKHKKSAGFRRNHGGLAPYSYFLWILILGTRSCSTSLTPHTGKKKTVIVQWSKVALEKTFLAYCLESKSARFIVRTVFF